MQFEKTCCPPRGQSLLNLPPELQAHVVSFLPYPDLLALKLTCTQFFTLVRTKKSHRVDWLLDRVARGLPVPSKSRCRWSTDEEFVNHDEVKQILRQRRTHKECYLFADQECRVVPGQVCAPLRYTRLRRIITGKPLVTGSNLLLVSAQPRLIAPYGLFISVPFLAGLGIMTSMVLCFINVGARDSLFAHLHWLWSWIAAMRFSAVSEHVYNLVYQGGAPTTTFA